MAHDRSSDPPKLAAVIRPRPVSEMRAALCDESVNQLRREERCSVDPEPGPVRPHRQLGDDAEALAGQDRIGESHLGDRIFDDRFDLSPDVGGYIAGFEPIDSSAHRFRRSHGLTERPTFGHTIGREAGVERWESAVVSTDRLLPVARGGGTTAVLPNSVPNALHGQIPSAGASWHPPMRAGSWHPACASRYFRSATPRWAAIGMQFSCTG